MKGKVAMKKKKKLLLPCTAACDNDGFVIDKSNTLLHLRSSAATQGSSLQHSAETSPGQHRTETGNN